MMRRRYIWLQSRIERSVELESSKQQLSPISRPENEADLYRSHSILHRGASNLAVSHGSLCVYSVLRRGLRLPVGLLAHVFSSLVQRSGPEIDRRRDTTSRTRFRSRHRAHSRRGHQTDVGLLRCQHDDGSVPNMREVGEGPPRRHRSRNQRCRVYVQARL